MSDKERKSVRVEVIHFRRPDGKRETVRYMLPGSYRQTIELLKERDLKMWMELLPNGLVFADVMDSDEEGIAASKGGAFKHTGKASVCAVLDRLEGSGSLH